MFLFENFENPSNILADTRSPMTPKETLWVLKMDGWKVPCFFLLLKMITEN